MKLMVEISRVCLDSLSQKQSTQVISPTVNANSMIPVSVVLFLMIFFIFLYIPALLKG